MALRLEPKLSTLVVDDRSVMIAQIRREAVLCSMDMHAALRIQSMRIQCGSEQMHTDAQGERHYRQAMQYNRCTCGITLLEGLKFSGNLYSRLLMYRSQATGIGGHVSARLMSAWHIGIACKLVPSIAVAESCKPCVNRSSAPDQDPGLLLPAASNQTGSSPKQDTQSKSITKFSSTAACCTRIQLHRSQKLQKQFSGVKTAHTTDTKTVHKVFTNPLHRTASLGYMHLKLAPSPLLVCCSFLSAAGPRSPNTRTGPEARWSSCP